MRIRLLVHTPRHSALCVVDIFCDLPVWFQGGEICLWELNCHEFAKFLTWNWTFGCIQLLQLLINGAQGIIRYTESDVADLWIAVCSCITNSSLNYSALTERSHLCGNQLSSKRREALHWQIYLFIFMDLCFIAHLQFHIFTWSVLSLCVPSVITT